MNRTFSILAIALLAGVAVLVGLLAPARAPSPALQGSVIHALGAPGRLVHASMTAWGDFDIEFLVREQGNADANRRAALVDALNIAHAVYEASPPRPTNVTLIGVWRPSAIASVVPVLYTSLPADRLVGVEWSRVRPEDLSTLGTVRWLPGGLCQAWRECAS